VPSECLRISSGNRLLDAFVSLPKCRRNVGDSINKLQIVLCANKCDNIAIGRTVVVIHVSHDSEVCCSEASDAVIRAFKDPQSAVHFIHDRLHYSVEMRDLLILYRQGSVSGSPGSCQQLVRRGMLEGAQLLQLASMEHRDYHQQEQNRNRNRCRSRYQ
jgi:hypothetical protein